MILLRGNGSPRTFRLSLPALQRSLTALGFAFAFAIAAAALLLLWNLLRFTPDRVEAPISSPAPIPVAAAPTPAPTAPAAAESTTAPAVPAKSGFWGNLTGKGDSTEDELHKELRGLREDIAKLNAEANGRKPLAPGETNALLQFFGPRNALESNSTIQVKNVKVARAGADLAVDFEITNVDPEQKQVRGYIVVLAKTPSLLLTYPEGVFSPDQNVVLDFTKGETFGVSRLRPTRATFPAAALEGKKPRFQVMLFNTAGKVISDFHVENN